MERPDLGGVADGLGLVFGPSGGAKDPVAIAAVGVPGCNLHHLFQQSIVKSGGIQPEFDKAAVINDQIVFDRLITRIGQVVHLGPG